MTCVDEMGEERLKFSSFFFFSIQVVEKMVSWADEEGGEKLKCLLDAVDMYGKNPSMSLGYRV